jgi:hypothetical protein
MKVSARPISECKHFFCKPAHPPREIFIYDAQLEAGSRCSSHHNYDPSVASLASSNHQHWVAKPNCTVLQLPSRSTIYFASLIGPISGAARQTSHRQTCPRSPRHNVSLLWKTKFRNHSIFSNSCLGCVIPMVSLSENFDTTAHCHISAQRSNNGDGGERHSINQHNATRRGYTMS